VDENRASESPEVYYGLPSEVKYCSRCVLSNQRPGSVVEFMNTGSEKKPTIFFDDSGVCGACRYADMKNNEIDWDRREHELRELCDRFRSRTGAYDIVVPGSGGKDSCFVSHMLKYKYGMNPLTVTWAPHKYTDIGTRNFYNWIDAGFDNLLHTPNGKVHRLLTRMAFENLCHPFQPFIIGQRMTGPRFAALFRIPLVMYGEHAAEYGDRVEEASQPRMLDRYYVHTPDIEKLFLGGVPARELIEKHGFRPSDLNPYLPIDGSLVREVGIEVHHFSYYCKWDPQENYYYAVENCGFESNSERTQGTYSKYSSFDDQIDPLHYYTTLAKFGIGRATYDAAQEIRTGKITREEGVALVRRFDEEFPDKYFQAMLTYMGIEESRFHEIVDKARSPHLWMKRDGRWVLRHPVS